MPSNSPKALSAATSSRSWRSAVAVLVWAVAFTAAPQYAVSETATPRPETASTAVEVVEPDMYRLDHYRDPVPKTLRGARVLSANDAVSVWTDQPSAVFIDVYPQAPKPPNLPVGTLWRDPVHLTIERAKWLPNVGYGVLAPAVADYFKLHLRELTANDASHPLVFFCVRNCWMSWNAAKRALDYGYSNVMWFSEGTDAWQEAGMPVADVKPEL